MRQPPPWPPPRKLHGFREVFNVVHNLNGRILEGKCSTSGMSDSHTKMSTPEPSNCIALCIGRTP